MAHWSDPVIAATPCPRCKQSVRVTFDRIGEVTSTGTIPEHYQGASRCGWSGRVHAPATLLVWQRKAKVQT
jgi:hypothetical protein